MESDRWLRVKQLFDSTVDLTPQDRSAFLADDCLDDAALRQEVESLVESSLRSGMFLENPVRTDGGALRGDLEGRCIGPYELGPRIGAGGMGDVYRARDTRLNRTVAVKVRADRLAEGSDLREQFAREANAISALSHPRICLLHDVGRHDSIDFLVMEYVEGEPIDVYCDRRGLNTRDRLSLFRTVCEAVHYAHQHLVVHRDLKPGNILVGADGQPKLLDFGIAKLLDATTPVEAPVATISRVLTPDYASPEQVRGQTVTTATDVYSLGVVLYGAARRPSTVYRAHGLTRGHRPQRLRDRGGATERCVAGNERRVPCSISRSQRAARRPRHHRPEGPAQGTRTPLSVCSSAVGRHQEVPRRPAGQRTWRRPNIPTGEVHHSPSSGRAGGSSRLGKRTRLDGAGHPTVPDR
jgi:serine/threonine protein kinase